MPIDRPRALADALSALAGDPAAEPVGGGTDLVLDVRSGRRLAPTHLVSLRRVEELRGVHPDGPDLVVGAAVTYAELSGPLAQVASRIGTPASRNAGTVGGALGTMAARGDLITFLTAADARVLLARESGERSAGVPELRAAGRDEGEIVTGVRIAASPGPSVYLKIAGRQAGAAAVLGCALVVDVGARRVGLAMTGLGCGGPVRLPAAERLAARDVDWAAGRADEDVVRAFGTAAAEEASPLVAAASVLDVDVPAGAPDRRWLRHATGVLAARALARCLGAHPMNPAA